MAQAARLNLRMQKELKLLLSDPPPGASFPHSDLSSFSLHTIHAQIEGPEDTVYGKGVFKIKIQIPEMYPFQPPIVTFATPIYHPNIDNGGRICLDILNLPPKGAWQPSLNISTVLTSIGLLLSEPNPDDGLMCEASKEYKYNRQAFDQKARSMTEKYARAGASENDSGSQSLQPDSFPSTMEAEGSDSLKCEVNEHFVSNKKLSGISKKLSLVSSGSSQKENANRLNEVPIHHLSENKVEVTGTKQESKDEKFCVTRRKLSLEFKVPTQMRNSNDEKVGPNQCSSLLNHESLCRGSLESSLVQPASKHYDQQTYQPEDRDFKSINDNININTTNTKRKKLGLAGRKPSLGPLGSSNNQENDNKENVDPLPSLLHPSTTSSILSQIGECYEGKAQNCDTNVARKKLCRIDRKLPLEPLQQLQRSNEGNIQLDLRSRNLNTTPFKPLPVVEDCRYNEKQQQDCDERCDGGIRDEGEGSPIPEDVIVLDSEDSEDERPGPLRSKLSLARKRLLGKWKVNA